MPFCGMCAVSLALTWESDSAIAHIANNTVYAPPANVIVTGFSLPAPFRRLHSEEEPQRRPRLRSHSPIRAVSIPTIPLIIIVMPRM